MDKNYIIKDVDELYRRVSINPINPNDNVVGYSVKASGDIIVERTAFFDRRKKISVDLAIKQGFNPKLSQDDPRDGVAKLIAGDVRRIRIKDYKIKVLYDPICDPENKNEAHSLIVMEPVGEKVEISDSAFRNLRRNLADIANEVGWALEPTLQ